MEKEREVIYGREAEKRGLSVEELQVLMDKWQKHLVMTDWKLGLKIVDFKTENNYRKSGDFVATPEKKEATILMTWDPWRGDEEYTLVHEMLHILVYDYDQYSEEFVLKSCGKDSTPHGIYMDKLETTVHHLTRIILGRSDR
jgi:hypothetical protein